MLHSHLVQLVVFASLIGETNVGQLIVLIIIKGPMSVPHAW